MPGRRQLVPLLVVALVSVVGLSTARAATAPAPASSTDWAMSGRDLDNTRAATDSPIRAANVAQLQVAWKTPVAGPLSTAPIVVGDAVYVQDGNGRVTAVGRATGSERWHSDSTGFNIGPFGVAVADGWGSPDTHRVPARSARTRARLDQVPAMRAVVPPSMGTTTPVM